ncbi:hypothetical protein DL769_007035 [Monosporascus sp. CRB-8-3]|nr:hypothetical protein DL769_007035 [Monosporascus sp. CRB-8-3]
MLDLQIPLQPPPITAAPVLPISDNFSGVNPPFGGEDGTDEFLRTLQESSMATGVVSQVTEEDPFSGPSRQCSVPSLNELRTMSGQKSATMTPALVMPPTIDMGDQTFPSAPVVDFISTIFNTQAKLAGLSQAVAEYLAWAKSLPNEAGNAELLEILEGRVMEMHQLASTKHWAAFKLMTASIERSDFYSTLKQLETDLTERTIRSSRFFHENYDIKASLAEQKIDLSD